MIDKFRVLNTIAFIVFCLSVGQVISILFASLFFNLNTVQILEAFKDPVHSDRSLIIFLSFSFTLFGLFLIPVSYLSLYNRSSIAYLWTNTKMQFIPLLFSVLIVFAIIPCMTVLIELNQSIEFPTWLSELEIYFNASEEKAGQLTNSLLSFRGIGDLIIVVFIMAIVPGVVEEIFFRGLVQLQLMDILKNQHLAVWFSALLFSFFHFQFYGFIPRLVLGSIFGYIFIWSGNIWYPCAAHAINNLIGVLGSFFWGPQIMNVVGETLTSTVLLLLSFTITVLILVYLRRMKGSNLLMKVNQPTAMAE